MATHIIIDSRTRKVRASLNAPGNGTTRFAVDLIGDTWHDFDFFLKEARASEHAKDRVGRNRSIRSGTAAFFSHIDGVVSDILKMLWDRANV